MVGRSDSKKCLPQLRGAQGNDLKWLFLCVISSRTQILRYLMALKKGKAAQLKMRPANAEQRAVHRL